MANIGYRTFDGNTDLVDVVLGNLASANSVPETWVFALRVLTGKTDNGTAGEIVHAPGYDPLDLYIANYSGTNWRYQVYNGSVDAVSGPQGTVGTDTIIAMRRGSGTAVRWSIATWNGSAWSSFTHTDDSITHANRTYPSSGVLEFMNTFPVNGRVALAARCSSAVSDSAIESLTTDLTAWTSLSTVTNVWRFDQTPVVDLKGTASQNSISGTSVTANGFPLDEGSSSSAAVTLAAATSSASGTFTAPDPVGSAAVTLGAATSNAIGSAPVVTSLGGTGQAANGTSRSLTLASSVAIGDRIIVAVQIDNTGTNGAAPATLTLSDSKSQTWGSPRVTQLVDPGAASAGAYLAQWDIIATAAMTTSDTITVTTGSSAAIAIEAAKLVVPPGSTTAVGTTGSSTTTAGTTATVTTGSLAVGEIVFGFAAVERTAAPTADSDTSNGTWNAGVGGQGGNSGTSTSNMAGILQWKQVTGTGTQTYNISWTTSTDACIGYTTFTVVPVPTGSAAVTLAPATATASGSYTSGSSVTGTAAVTLAAATSSAAGSSVRGSAAVTLGAATSTAAGSTVRGSAAVTLAAATTAATGAYGTDVLNDDFTTLDRTTWVLYNRLGDQNNNEVNAVIPANVRVSGGSLFIDSKFEDVVAGDTTTGAPNPRTVHYTSGQVHAKPLFKYGDVRVEAKAPGGTGLWPCIWMLGFEWQASQPFTANVPGYNWPYDGWWEIDIAEFVSNHRSDVNCAVHFNGSNYEEHSLPYDATSRFMIYRLLWTPTSLTWYVDAQDGVGWRTLKTVTGTAGSEIPNTPGYLVLHTAIGGNPVGSPDSATFPQSWEFKSAQILRTSDTVEYPSGIVYTTLNAATSNASGGPVTGGTAAVTLGAATSSAAGSTVKGTAAVTLAAATASATGTHSITGSAAPTLGAATSSATGQYGSTPTGTAAVTLAAATATASGSTVTGTAAVTLTAASSSASGGHGPSGTATVTLSAATSSVSGARGAAGTATPTLAAAVSSASGSIGSNPVGTVAVTLAAATSTATGSHSISGSVAITLAAATSSGAGSQAFGTATVVLAAATGSATGARGAAGTATITLGPVTSTSSGAVGAKGTAAVVLAAATSQASSVGPLQQWADIATGGLTLSGTTSGLALAELATTGLEVT